jgi:3-dehydroquinate dehydratase-2
MGPRVKSAQSPLHPRTIWIVSGPNLNLLGSREPELYGRRTLAEVERDATAVAHSLGFEAKTYQSNHEGQLIDWLHEASAQQAAGIVLNPGGLTHTSVALRDAIAAITPPCVEVHLSNLHRREEFRRHSWVSAVCVGTIAGFGGESYSLGVRALIGYIEQSAQPPQAASRAQ